MMDSDKENYVLIFPHQQQINKKRHVQMLHASIEVGVWISSHSFKRVRFILCSAVYESWTSQITENI